MNTILENYVSLLDFISLSIGPDYELSLIDTSNAKNKIIAMRCGNISGKHVGEKMLPILEEAISNREYETSDYIVNRAAFGTNGKALRTSMFFIKDESKQLLGIMSINFDDSRYEDLGKRILQLCHPDGFEEDVLQVATARKEGKGSGDYHGAQEEKRTLEQTIEDIVDGEFRNIMIPLERLTQEEKIGIVRNLDNKGVFMIKGAVGILAKRLDVSQASLYRYITIAREENK
ncbi:MAG: hypothetical protein GXY89_02505 [Tissierellia bacterium]|jgi:predicted transcriptional regulator YheO|nr:hypothetical protein [Tissierellia bacterium]